MSEKVIPEIAVVGIDIGKTSFHVTRPHSMSSAWIAVERWPCDRGGRAAKWRYDLPTCRLAWSAWKLASVRTT